jgi:hypothetical protein
MILVSYHIFSLQDKYYFDTDLWRFVAETQPLFLVTKRSQVLVLAHGKKNAPLDGENKPPSWVDKWVKPGFAWLKTQFAKGWNYVVSTLCKHKPLSTEPGPIANFFLIKTAPFHPREPRDFLTARLIQRELLKPLLRDHQMEPPLTIPPPAAKETSS